MCCVVGGGLVFVAAYHPTLFTRVVSVRREPLSVILWFGIGEGRVTGRGLSHIFLLTAACPTMT